MPMTAAMMMMVTTSDPLIASFMGPTCSPSGADRTQVGPMLAPWTLLSGSLRWSWWCHSVGNCHGGGVNNENGCYMCSTSNIIFFDHGCGYLVYTDGSKVALGSTLFHYHWYTSMVIFVTVCYVEIYVYILCLLVNIFDGHILCMWKHILKLTRLKLNTIPLHPIQSQQTWHKWPICGFS